MKLKLDKIKYDVPGSKMKKGKMKKISNEDRWSMASLQPACHAKGFSNDYFLTVTTEYDGCVCCIDLPDAKMKVTIVPLVNPACIGLAAPEDFSPEDLGSIDCGLNQCGESD